MFLGWFGRGSWSLYVLFCLQVSRWLMLVYPSLLTSSCGCDSASLAVLPKSLVVLLDLTGVQTYFFSLPALSFALSLKGRCGCLGHPWRNGDKDNPVSCNVLQENDFTGKPKIQFFQARDVRWESADGDTYFVECMARLI